MIAIPTSLACPSLPCALLPADACAFLPTSLESPPPAPGTPAQGPRLVRLGSEHLRAICAHFEGLDEEGLRLRFGRPMGAEQIRQYVHGLDFARDAVVGLALSSPLPTQARSEERCRQLDDKGSEVPLVGLCHLATVVEGGRLTGDIGISLSPPWRGQGLAGVLLRACLAEAAQRRMSEVCLVYQQHNQRMAALCRRFGASFSHGGGEVEARLAVAAG